MTNLQNSISGLYDVSYKLNQKIRNVNSQTGYTAFQVYPTSAVISAGTLYKDIPYLSAYCPTAYLNEECAEIKAKADISIAFRSSVSDLTKWDVVIDWGDMTDELKMSENGSTTATHTYTVTNQPYIVKIYGQDYYEIKVNYGTGSIISRLFDNDLPIASNLNTLYGAFGSCDRLFKINIDKYGANINRLNEILNWGDGPFGGSNLLEISEFKYWFGYRRTCSYMCSNLGNLRKSDIRIQDTSDSSYMYAGCTKLTGDVTDFFFTNNFTSKAINISNIFKGSGTNGVLNGFKYLTCDTTKLAKLLWQNPNITWTATGAFSGLKTIYRKYIPTSFGGCDTVTTITDTVATFAELPQAIAKNVGKIYYVTADDKYYILAYSNDTCEWFDCSDRIVTQADVDSSAAIQAKIDSGYWKQSSDGIIDAQFKELSDKVDELKQKI